MAQFYYFHFKDDAPGETRKFDMLTHTASTCSPSLPNINAAECWMGSAVVGAKIVVVPFGVPNINIIDTITDTKVPVSTGFGGAPSGGLFR